MTYLVDVVHLEVVGRPALESRADDLVRLRVDNADVGGTTVPLMFRSRETISHLQR